MSYAIPLLQYLPPVGSLVRVFGLEKRKDLNGKFGLVHSHPEATDEDESTTRVAVRVYEDISEASTQIEFKADVSVQLRHLERIEICVLIASHLTSYESFNKLIAALKSMDINQFQFDDSARKEPMVYFRPKILIGCSADSSVVQTIEQKFSQKCLNVRST